MRTMVELADELGLESSSVMHDAMHRHQKNREKDHALNSTEKHKVA